MLADRQTDRHTDRRVDHNTPHNYRSRVAGLIRLFTKKLKIAKAALNCEWNQYRVSMCLNYVVFTHPVVMSRGVHHWEPWQRPATATRHSSCTPLSLHTVSHPQTLILSTSTTTAVLNCCCSKGSALCYTVNRKNTKMFFADIQSTKPDRLW